MTEPVPASTVRDRFADAGLRRSLVAMVRRRVPPHEVDEIVQSTLADACASKTVPSEADALERWVRGIARHKIADYHRHAHREVSIEPDALAASAVSDHSAHEAADLLRWAERESDRDDTLDWLLREGDGEKLQTIAREEQVPAARVRQRVARLRRHFRARWAAQIAAALAMGALIMWLMRPKPPVVAPVVVAPSAASAPTPPNPAIELRRFALELCEKKEWRPCLDGLDRAAGLDPAGEDTDAVKTARSLAAKGLEPKVVNAPKDEKKPAPFAAPPKSTATTKQTAAAF
jgi:DNA-directed RNA polymerase specialized sigma24 family protein